MMDCLFVYGLLRRGAKHEMSKILDQSASYISSASFQGKLYLVDYYPGVVPSKNSNAKVVGDIYRITDMKILEELDRFEGVGPEFESPNEYNRENRIVRLPNDETLASWIYLYNWPVREENEIPSGDFLSFLAAR